MIVRFIGAALVLIILANLFQLLRHRRLREKYAVLWFAIGLVVIVLALFPGLLDWASNLVGIEVPSNLLFAAMLVLVLGVALHLTWEQSRSEDRIRRLSEEIALLRAQVRVLDERTHANLGTNTSIQRDDPSDALLPEASPKPPRDDPAAHEH